MRLGLCPDCVRSLMETVDDRLEFRLYPDARHALDLLQTRKTYADYLRLLSRNYIWQSDPVQIDAVDPADEASIPTLRGSLDCRGNVEDEWFVVYLLVKLSEKDENLVVSVWDSDGQFLLIEAAHFLPAWLEPETATNRVFIHRGAVHILPPPRTPAEVTVYPTGTPDLKAALSLIRGRHVITEAAHPIQTIIGKRVATYPSSAESSAHFAHAYVPAKIAFVFDTNPQLISHVVRAFGERDPLDMKACLTMKHFPPVNCVTYRVQFSRRLYAQLQHQKFFPPSRSPWAKLGQGVASSKAKDLGVKIAYGFEILCSQCNGGGEESSLEWHQYVASLHRKGYFEGEMEGSRRYRELADAAREYFDEHLKDAVRKVHPGMKVLDIVGEFSAGGKTVEERLLLPESDDSWLSIDVGELDQLLKERAGLGEVDDEECLDAISAMKQGVRQFVTKVSGFEGAELPGKSKLDQVQFDADSFVDVLEKVLKGKVDERYSSDEDDGDDEDDDIGLDDMSEEDDDGPRESLKGYMEDLDRELASTEVGKSFEKVPREESDRDAAASPPPTVDIDLNLVKNILESYSSQDGQAGPASNLLGAMGITIPVEEN